MPVVQLTTHVISSTLYGRTVHTSKFFWLDGLLLFCIIMGLYSASSVIKLRQLYSCSVHFKDAINLTFMRQNTKNIVFMYVP